MLVDILVVALAVFFGVRLGTTLRKLRIAAKTALTKDTPITLSLVEVEEAGLARLIGDLTRFKAFADTVSGEKFVEIPLEDLFQVMVQKMRQLNLEVGDLATKNKE